MSWQLSAWSGMVLALGACDLGAVPFHCERDEQCVEGGVKGVCEPEGSCSFPDLACQTMRRFALHAPEPLRERCVEACIAAVALGDRHGCLLKVDGTVWCWGSNDAGQVGPGAPLGSIAPPSRVEGLPPVRTLAAGGSHNCAITRDDHLYCWGDGRHGETGHGALAVHSDPREVVREDGSPLSPVDRISLGAAHSCATSEGELYCWGHNDVGQVSDVLLGEAVPVATLLQSVPSTAIAVLELGGDSTCVRAGDAVYCWGDGSCGKLAVEGDQVAPMEIVRLAAMEGPLTLGVGHGCGFDGEGVACWGAWDGKACGLGRIEPDIGVFSRSLLAIEAGRAHTCVVDEADGDVLCWGSNACVNTNELCWQLGESATISTATAIVVPLDGRAVDLATGGDTTCALLSDGRLWCWGDNSHGQLGVPPAASPKDGAATDAVSRVVACGAAP